MIILSLILFHQCQATYPTQKCLICSGESCESAKPQVCPGDINDPKSGAKFVDTAFGTPNATATVSANFEQYVKSLGLNESLTTWNQLTRYVFLSLFSFSVDDYVEGKKTISSRFVTRHKMNHVVV